MTTIKYPEIMLILDGDQHHLLVQQVVGVILGYYLECGGQIVLVRGQEDGHVESVLEADQHHPLVQQVAGVILGAEISLSLRIEARLDHFCSSSSFSR